MAEEFKTDGYACRVVDLKKEYVLKSETVRALRGVTFDVPVGFEIFSHRSVQRLVDRLY